MRRAIVLLVCWVAAWGAVGAVTRYVDGGCTVNGTGANIDCGATGPFNNIESAVDAGALTAGDHIQIRGVHAFHGSNHAAGIFDGRYSSNDWITITKAGGIGSPIVLENYGYTGAFGSGEVVIIEGTAMPAAGWTKCTSGCTGTCTGVTPPCLEVWYTSGVSPYAKVLAAQKPDGSVTYRESTLAAVNAQFESYSNQTNLWVRWGSGGDTSAAQAPLGSANPKPYVLFDNNGHTLDFGFTGDASNWTVQGLTLRNTVHQGVVIRQRTPAQSGITIKNNVIQYAGSTAGAGDDYGIVVYLATGTTIDGNDISDTGSEAIHVQAPTAGTPADVTITNNYIHRICDQTVMGPNTCGTPHCMTLGDSGGGFGGGDYSGDHISGNLCTDVHNLAGHAYAKGIQLENHHDGSLVHDNIFVNLDGPAIQFSGEAGTGVDSVQAYNNIAINVARSPGSGPLSMFEVADKTTNAKIFNNTSSGQGLLEIYGGTTTLTGNKVRNNLGYKSIWDNQKFINWGAAGTSSGNSFQNNLLFASGATASSIIATISGVNFQPPGPGNVWGPTKDVDGDASPDANVWGDPGFTLADCSLSDYRLHPTNAANQANPAIDAGTMTGMPARTGIHNTIASAHGLPDYSRLQTTNIGSLPDIGAWEMLLKDGSFESGSIDAPWNVPLGAPTICPFYPTSISTGAIGGTKAMNLTTGPCLESICSSNCRKMIVQQAFAGLEVGRNYSLVGSWKVVSGTPDATAFVAFVSCTAAECALDPFNSDPPPCSVLVGGDSSVGFICPSFMVPSNSSMTIAIIPSTNFGVAVAIDNLELR